MNTKAKGAIAAVTATAIVLTGIGLQPVAAQPGIHQAQAGSATDFSSRGRYYRGGNAAALGAFLAIAGTAVAIAATRHRQRDYYEGYPAGYAYGYQPNGYGYAAPNYGYAGPRYYGGPRAHYWHHRW
jgi:hypothetical protein